VKLSPKSRNHNVELVRAVATSMTRIILTENQ